MPSIPLVQQEKAQQIVVHDLMAAEESILQQKSSIKWSQLGDQNTSFFHKAVKGKQSRNAIKSVFAANGTTLSNSDDIQAKF